MRVKKQRYYQVVGKFEIVVSFPADDKNEAQQWVEQMFGDAIALNSETINLISAKLLKAKKPRIYKEPQVEEQTTDENVIEQDIEEEFEEELEEEQEQGEETDEEPNS